MASFFAVTLTVGMLVVLAAPATLGSHAGVQSPSDFAQIPGVYDIEVTSTRVLVSHCGPSPKRNITSIDHQGRIVPFATIPQVPDFDPVQCVSAPLLADSPGLGNFPEGNVYVSYGPRIFTIPPEGCPGGGPSCVEEFAFDASVRPSGDDLSSLPITFDQAGSFDRRMIVLNSVGEGWKVDHLGQAERFSQALGSDAQAGVVAPYSFEPYGGHLLVPHTNPQRVDFVAPSGGISYTFFPPPESELGPGFHNVFVPSEICELGQSQGAFFQARAGSFPQQEGIRKFRRDDFTSKEGNALIFSSGSQGELGYEGMFFLAPNGTGPPSRSPFHTDPPGPLRFGAGDFADCPDPWSATVSDEVMEEGTSGSSAKVVFRLALSPTPAGPTKVQYQTRPGSAEEGSDFLPARGELTFGAGPAGINGTVPGVSLAGENSAEIEVTVLGDSEIERDERFFLEIIDPSKPEVLQAQGIATIINDDKPAPYVPVPPPAPQPAPAGSEEQPPAPELEESLPPPTTHLGPAAPAAVGPQLPPPAPPGTAPAPSAGPAPGTAPGPSIVAGQSASTIANPISVPAFGPAPAPQVVPGVAGMKEEKVQAAPESDYAMVVHQQAEEAGPGMGLLLAGTAMVLILAGCCFVASARNNNDGQLQPCPSLR